MENVKLNEILEILNALSNSVESLIDFTELIHDTDNWRGTDENLELLQNLDNAKSALYWAQHTIYDMFKSDNSKE